MKRKQFLVIGAGRFGSAVAETLYDLGQEVVVVDDNEDAIQDIMNKVTHALIADATDEAVLQKLGVSNFDTVVVAIGSNLEANILATVAAKSCGAKRIVCKAISKIAAQVLSKVGADEVVRPEHDMGVRLAKHVVAPSIIDSFDLGKEHSVVELEVTEHLQGTLAELQLSNRFGVQVIAVHNTQGVQVSPKADHLLQHHDTVVVIGKNDAIERLRDHLNR